MPGGLVLHLYDGDDQLLVVQQIDPLNNWVPTDEMMAAGRTGKAPMCLVVYDGDTGARWANEDFEGSGLRSGMRLT